MNAYAALAVGIGGVAGCWLRWCFNTLLNPLNSMIPLGTVAANLLAGLLMGFAIETFAARNAIPREIQLLVTTGFLGGLSTFSAFSADVANLLLNQQYGWGALAILLHVAGSVALTVLGIMIMRAVLGAAA